MRLRAERSHEMERSTNAPTPHAPVALVNMPFASAGRPSIQCGLLKSALARRGVAADVHYLNLELAAELGPRSYKALSQLRANLLLGEWLFGPAAFGDALPFGGDSPHVPSVTSFCNELGLPAEQLIALRSGGLPRWVEYWATKVDWNRYAVVGFTSTFEQNNASFALAQRIKALAPTTRIVFGGANFDGDMGAEYVRALPYIDYAVVGEGDVAFPQLVERVLQGHDAIGLPGVIARRNGAVVGQTPAELITELDSLPDPSYDEYFVTLDRLSAQKVLGDTGRPFLLIESSRGCWWGQKHHCTFCGLNANSMKYRSKSADATLKQMARLAHLHKTTNFEAVDNILDYRYISELCASIERERTDFNLFYEVKANLRRDQLKAMASGGIRSIQPGIESLNSHILGLMHKGTTMLQNIRCLKWAAYYGIEVAWNILTDFPGETSEDYAQQEDLLPLIMHLQPPNNFGRIWLERFSPYFADPSFPLRNVRPLRAYHAVYPPQQLSIEKIAYFFDYDMDETVPDEAHTRLASLVATWKERWRDGPRPRLTFQRAPDWMRIIDRRGARERSLEFDGVEGAIYEACVEIERTPSQLRDRLEGRLPESANSSVIATILARFCEAGLVVEESGKFLALAVPMNRNW